MDNSYIAGFFDGEGSAMIITIRRRLKTGIIYRFRPVIKIHQKTHPILKAINNHLGYGHIDLLKGGYALIINGLDGVLKFNYDVGCFCVLKHQALVAVSALAIFQREHRRKNVPYTEDETKSMLNMRGWAFEANSITRSGLTQKYSNLQILTESTFVTDIEAWKKHRSRGIIKQ